MGSWLPRHHGCSGDPAATRCRWNNLQSLKIVGGQCFYISYMSTSILSMNSIGSTIYLQEQDTINNLEAQFSSTRNRCNKQERH